MTCLPSFSLVPLVNMRRKLFTLKQIYGLFLQNVFGPWLKVADKVEWIFKYTKTLIKCKISET